MDSTKDIKSKVSDIVEAYIRTYPTEYATFRKYMKDYKANVINKWVEIPHSTVQLREINRMPEMLASLIKIGLSDDEYAEFREAKFQAWFSNKFTDMRVTEGKL